jgi:hypothetical protein
MGAHFARGRSVVLGLCSPLPDSDLGLWDKPHVGGVVVTILTSGCRRRVNAVPMPAGKRSS